ncbi:MAG: TMEM165/GDT1 family protein [Candidatus Omnitrophica bacterium]|nr:TMEM165/GDT1 family protein [Candidatus Omnitrophota bacterium]
MAAFIASFLFVLLSEMGYKTQLLAIAIAMRFRADKVLFAVFLATLINHALAVLLGHFLKIVIPFKIISFIAALFFIGFGLWTLHGDKLHGEEKRVRCFGPVATVAISFFLGRCGMVFFPYKI